MTHNKVISILILIGLIVLFTAQNYEIVEIQLLFWKIAMSRALLIYFVLAIGMAVGWLIRGFRS